MISTRPYLRIDRPPFSRFVPNRIRLKVEEINRKSRRAYLKRVVPAGDFPIIACNCWGGEIYKDLDRPFHTPFIGLYLMPACYLNFARHYAAARMAPLTFTDKSRYLPTFTHPVGLILGDIEIHFVHYESQEEARDKWQRRSQRLPENPDDAYFMLGEGSETLEQKREFLSLPFRSKVLFASRPTPGFTGEVVVPPWRGDAMLQGPGLYDQCYAYFDIARWLRREA